MDDPSTYLDEPQAQEEREELHEIISELVKWENTNNENVLTEARYEIARSIARSHSETAPTDADAILRYLAEKAPPIYDPFCGGGSIPLEVQRLGLRARASDLNPVAVLLNKALIELPPNFYDQPPINPDTDSLEGWRGTSGLANDIRYYGKWMREEAYRSIGHLYPKAQLSDRTEATVIAWLWVPTVTCSNPACRVPMPLTKTFQLSTRRGNAYWTRPIIGQTSRTLSFVVQNHNFGVPDSGTVKRAGVTCVTCSNSVRLEYVREEARNGNMKEIMAAIVAEGDRGRLFLSPNDVHIETALSAQPSWRPRGTIPEQALGISLQNYGITQWHQLFTDRQLTTLATFSDLISEVRQRTVQDGATEDYADALCTYLALAIGKTADGGCKGAIWKNSGDFISGIFTLPAIPIIWVLLRRIRSPVQHKIGWDR